MPCIYLYPQELLDSTGTWSFVWLLITSEDILHNVGTIERYDPTATLEWIPRTKGHAVTRKMFPFDDVIMH